MKLYAVILLSVFFLAALCSGEIQLNSQTVNDQKDADVAFIGSDKVAAVWNSYLQDGSSGTIVANIFDASGNALGEEFIVNQTTTDNQRLPDIAADANGNFMIVWEGSGQFQEDIFGRIYDSNGQGITDEFVINDFRDNRQMCPAVAANDEGRFLVVWESENVTENLLMRSICGKFYGKNGEQLSSEFTINSNVTRCRYPDAVVLDDNGAIVTWVRESTTQSIYKQKIQPDGSIPYLDCRVDSQSFSSLTEPRIAAEKNGYYAIVWDSHQITYEQDDVYIVRYHWSDAAMHDPTIINSSTIGAQQKPDIAMSPEGLTLVVWHGQSGLSSSLSDIYGQMFDIPDDNSPELKSIGAEFKINNYLFDAQSSPAVIMRDEDDYFVLWQSQGQDDSGSGIFADRGPIVKKADFNVDGFVDFADFCIFASYWLEKDTPICDLFNDLSINGRDLEEFSTQWAQLLCDCERIDFEIDGNIDFADFAHFANAYKHTGPKIDEDMNNDGYVNVGDMPIFTSCWAGKK